MVAPPVHPMQIDHKVWRGFQRRIKSSLGLFERFGSGSFIRLKVSRRAECADNPGRRVLHWGYYGTVGCLGLPMAGSEKPVRRVRRRRKVYFRFVGAGQGLLLAVGHV
jgi:hypothetical protein